jgi:hypothetical protein
MARTTKRTASDLAAYRSVADGVRRALKRGDLLVSHGDTEGGNCLAAAALHGWSQVFSARSRPDAKPARKDVGTQAGTDRRRRLPSRTPGAPGQPVRARGSPSRREAPVYSADA